MMMLKNGVRIPSETCASRTQSAEWGSLCWIANQEISGTAAVSAARVVIRAGKSNPRHVHDDTEEILHLLSGTLSHRVGDEDETVDLSPGDTLVIPPGVPHSALSTGNSDAEMIVIYSSGTRSYRETSPD